MKLDAQHAKKALEEVELEKQNRHAPEAVASQQVQRRQQTLIGLLAKVASLHTQVVDKAKLEQKVATLQVLKEALKASLQAKVEECD
ncbi:hypothetical protein R1flu_003622 [Riccia fluitans]|uniref:Uncharacterized protein n=1 Tax=Riccia fluitans TaxID=41844 RepID=A0ABD1YCY6_9MARC